VVSSGFRSAGTLSLTWDGKNTAGTLQPAGTYTWRFSAKDRGGTITRTGWLTVKVSRAKLTARTSTLTLRGARAYDWGGSDACATGTGTGSTYAPNGLWLKNNCVVSNPQNALAFYAFALPRTAITYTNLRVASAGRSHSPPSDVAAGVYSSQTDDYDLTPTETTAGSGAVTLAFGSFGAAGHVVSRKADVLVLVPNLRAPLTDWDISTVRLVVNYKVLA
jgi:hypothetical protein